MTVRTSPPSSWVLCAAMAFGVGSSSALAQQKAVRGMESEDIPCGKIYQDRYGPYDYRNERDKLKVVEEFHFSQKVEYLIQGLSGHFGHDLNYTLMSSPNHHRALLAAVRYAEKTKSPQPFGLQYPVECYFDRALRFRPDDTVARALYAQFLHKHNRTAEGIRELDVAVTYAADSAFSHYNIGLIYLELGDSKKALVEAHRAIELGVTRTELMDGLKKIGKWHEPPPEVAAAAASAAAPSATASEPSGSTAAAPAVADRAPASRQ